MIEPPTRSQGGTSEYLLIVALIVVLTLGAFTVFGDDLRRLLTPVAAEAPASAWPTSTEPATSSAPAP